MGYRIPGHGDCLICHPDLNIRYGTRRDRARAKRNAKGKFRIKPSVRRKLQMSVEDETKDLDP